MSATVAKVGKATMTNIVITTHTGQLTRIGDDMVTTCEDSETFGHLRILRWFLYAGELIAPGFGLFHLSHGATGPAITAFAIELFIIIVHIIESTIERRLHHNHEQRVQSLRDELMDKEDDMIGTAEAFNIRVRRWYRRVRRGY
jgi:hypothetical protein